ncbi:MAG: hypothetical protein HC801_10945 [Nitrospira sp.]|nr:hypothetical protein [Nitrospira sp.]
MNASDPKTYTLRGVDSMPADLRSLLHLAPVEDKAVDLDFDGGRLSSDGGLVLLNDPDEQLGLTRHLAAVLRDPPRSQASRLYAARPSQATGVANCCGL